MRRKINGPKHIGPFILAYIMDLERVSLEISREVDLIKISCYTTHRREDESTFKIERFSNEHRAAVNRQRNSAIATILTSPNKVVPAFTYALVSI